MCRNLQPVTNMKKILILTVALAALNASAVFTWNSGMLNSAIPDNNPNGWVNSANITTAPAGTVQSVAVTLNLSGGWNGDLFAYLVNSGGGFCVLLDRVGMGEFGVGSYGYSGAGMTDVTLGATGGSIHAYGGGLLTGPATYSVDASETTLGLGNSGTLASFVGANPNSTWTLFVADLNGGGVTTVSSWGLQMDIVAVPEVETWIAAALAGAFGAFWLNRQIMLGVKKA